MLLVLLKWALKKKSHVIMMTLLSITPPNLQLTLVHYNIHHSPHLAQHLVPHQYRIH